MITESTCKGRQQPEIPGYMDSLRNRLARAVRNLSDDQKSGTERRSSSVKDAA